MEILDYDKVEASPEVAAILKKEKRPKHHTDTDLYEGLHQSTQTFRGIGMFEAQGGDVILRGRHGERDHLYPIERACEQYRRGVRQAKSLAKYAVRGWDTLVEVNEDLKHYILEAIKQRRSMNRDIPQVALDFEQAHGVPGK